MGWIRRIVLKKDVLAWRPEVVVLGFPEHDLFRTMTVYPLINWPEWDARFSKPRLVLDQGALRSLNVPTIPPNKMSRNALGVRLAVCGV